MPDQDYENDRKGIEAAVKTLANLTPRERLIVSMFMQLGAGPSQSAASKPTETLALLSPRERQILDLIAAGKTNKQVGHELDISPRTVEVHRRRIMKKTGAANVADLMRLYLTTYPAS